MAKEANIYPNSIDTRVALLEQSIGMINQTLIEIKHDMKEGFQDIRTEIKELRMEMREEMRDIKKWSWTHFVFLFGAIAGLGVIGAHGFHWF